MIGLLEGKIRHKAPDGLIIDVQGVGYCVQVPLSTFYDLPDHGRSVSLFIHTYVREDAIQLFGFRSAGEKEMFLHLMTVNGVGPRLAVNILSGIDPDGLRQVVLENNLQRLRGLPGVGKKIAERIVMELRDKLKIKGEERPDECAAAVAGDGSAYADAFSALCNLGYKASEAERALQRAKLALEAGAPLEQLLRETLRFLA